MNIRPLNVIHTTVMWALLATACVGCSFHRVEEDPQPLVAAGTRYNEARSSEAPYGEAPYGEAPYGEAPYGEARSREIPSAASENAETPPAERIWWLTFGDPTLDALVHEALSSNLDLERTAALITRAAAVLRQAGARLFPTVDADASYASTWTERSGSESFGGGRRDGDEHDEAAGVGLSLAWELDAWGRLRAVRRAAEFRVEAAAGDREVARLLLSASVVETYFEILEQRLQLALIERQIRTNTTLLDLTRLRFGQGQSSIVDVLQQREQLASTRALVPFAQSRLDELEYALDVLLGSAPGTRPRIETDAFPETTAWPPLGVPSDLLSARPDLRATQRRVVAIDHLVGEAIADRLPRFGLGASVSGSGDLRPDKLIASVLGDMLLPVFDAGARVALVDMRRADLRAAVAAWSHAYLTAVREVDTAIALERGQVERVELQEEQLAIARQLLRETRNRYSQGLTDYLPVLAALATQQNLERELITSRRTRLSLRVGLHRALGGPMPGENSAQSRRATPSDGDGAADGDIE